MNDASRRQWPLNLVPADLIGAEFYGPDMVNIHARFLQSLRTCWHVRAMTGFFTGWNGDDELLPALREALIRPTQPGKSMIVVDPFGGPACADALETVTAGVPEPTERVRVHATRLVGSGDPSSRVLMHSKLWLFRMPDHAEIWIGSANATRTAVTGMNVESTCVLRVRPEATAYRDLVAQVKGFYKPGQRTKTDLQSTLPVSDALLSFIRQNLVRRPAWTANLSSDIEHADWLRTRLFLYSQRGALPLTAMLQLGDGQVLQLERQAYAKSDARLARALASQERGQFWVSLPQDRKTPVTLHRGVPPVGNGDVGEYTVGRVRQHYRPRMKWVKVANPPGMPTDLRFEKLEEVTSAAPEPGVIYVEASP